MRLNDYQQQAIAFAKYNHLSYPFLALGEEAGEVLGKLAKHVRKNSVTLETAIEDAARPTDLTGTAYHPQAIELHDSLRSELGDVLWQLQACCSALGMKLEDVAQDNLLKLAGREARGTIVGNGDVR